MSVNFIVGDGDLANAMLQRRASLEAQQLFFDPARPVLLARICRCCLRPDHSKTVMWEPHGTLPISALMSPLPEGFSPRQFAALLEAAATMLVDEGRLPANASPIAAVAVPIDPDVYVWFAQANALVHVSDLCWSCIERAFGIARPALHPF